MIEKEGIELTISGSAENVSGNPSNDTERFVSRQRAGMGVWDKRRGEEKQIDGEGTLETLSLDFSHTVELIWAKFRSVDRNDEFTLSVDGDLEVPETDLSRFFRFDSFETVGTNFGFSVTDRNDDYFLYKVKVAKVAEAVPEPALMLGLGAVAAAGLLAQKRSRKETA